MAKKREDRSKAADEGGFGNAFAGLAGLRADLPPAEVSQEPHAESGGDSGASPRAKKLVVRREKSGRGGKTVTVVEGLGPEREGLAREMKKALGCGAKVEGERLVLQGAQVERAATWLEDRGYPRVVRGN